MDAQQDVEYNSELKKVHQLLAKNIDDFKSLVLYNMRLEENAKPANETSRSDKSSRPSNETLRLDVNRISDYQSATTENTQENKAPENLEEWVAREFATKPVQKESAAMTIDVPGETMEEWVARLRTKPRNAKTSRPTLIDSIELWLMNEAKKDLFAQMDAAYGNPKALSSEHIRELGTILISLADKLDKMKTN